MRILFLGINDQNRVASGQYYMRSSLEEHVEIVNYGPLYQDKVPQPIDVRRLEKLYTPDVVLIQGFWWTNKGPVLPLTNLRKVKALKALFYSDPHNSPDMRAKWINNGRIDLSLHHYWRGWINRLRGVWPGHKKLWLPWCAPIHVFKDYGYRRVYDVALLGTVEPSFYPLRYKIWKALVKRRDMKVYRQPRAPRGYHTDMRTALARENYARALSRCRTAVVTASKLGYATLKYFETMACKTLTLADTPTDAERLHFRAGSNYAQIDSKNFVQKIKYYIEHEDERVRIAQNGYDAIHKHHTCGIRGEQLFNIFEEELNAR